MIQRIQQNNVSFKAQTIKSVGKIMSYTDGIDSYSGLKTEFHDVVMSRYQNFDTAAEKIKAIKEEIILGCKQLGKPVDTSINDENNFEVLDKKLQKIDDETFDRLIQKGYFGSQLKTYIAQLRIFNFLGR